MANSDIWTAAHVKSLAPDAASIPAAREVLKKGGFGTVEPTGDGRGWWVVCRGITDTYQVSVRRAEGADGEFDCECTCPSYKNPCKHALALLLYLVDHPEERTEAEAPKTAASDFEALLRAVFHDPEDDTARLVFADFLEENDQPDRAALIRYQCERVREKPNSKRHRELEKLLKPLVAKVREQIEPLPEGTGYSFARGFLHLECPASDVFDAGALPARFTNLFRDGWVESLRTAFLYYGRGEATGVLPLLAQIGELNVSQYAVPDDVLVTLVADTSEARATGRLVRVKVHKRNQKVFDQLVMAQQGEEVALTAGLGAERRHYGLTPRVFDLLLRSGRLGGARDLYLNGALGDAEVSDLVATADLSQLEELRLVGWALSRTGIEALANSAALPRLSDLTLESCALGTGAVAALAAATGLPRLDSLRLPECDMSDSDAAALANARGLSELSHLDLALNRRLTARGAAAVLGSPRLPALNGLGLSDTGIERSGCLPLVLDAPDRPVLELSFDAGRVRRRVNGKEVIADVLVGASPDDLDDLFGGLAGCAGAQRVTQFSAPRTGLGAPAVPALAAGLDPKTLWLLDLSDTPLRNDGATALATAFARFKLRELHLRACRIQTLGVLALVNGPLLAGVEVLDLSRNAIGKAGAAALLNGGVPPALKELVLKECRLTDVEKKQLAAKFGARVKF